MLPVSICRHWDVEWLGSTSCYCNSCGKVGQWFDGLVLWQRRPRPLPDERDDSPAVSCEAGLDGDELSYEAAV